MVKRRFTLLNRLLLVVLSVSLISITSVSVKAESKSSLTASEGNPSDAIAKDLSSNEPYYYSVSKSWDQNNVAKGTQDIEIDAAKFNSKSEDAQVALGSYHGEDHVLLWPNPKGWVEYKVEVDQEGIYELAADYFPYVAADGGNKQSVMIGVQLNGGYPFREAHSLVLERQYVDVKPVKYDEAGNQLRSLLEEITEWRTTSLRGSEGSNSTPLLWHFNKGENTIQIQALSEGVAIKSFRLKVPTTVAPYDEVSKQYPKVINSGSKTPIVVEGENFSSKNMTSIQTKYDRSPLTQPKSIDLVRYNTIGGYGWDLSGQAVTWDFEVPENGLYQFTLRSKQSLHKNLAVFRSIKIDGVFPFAEMKNYPFPYSSDWKATTLEDDNGDPYQFYLLKGKHSIRMEANFEPYVPVVIGIDQMSKAIREITQELRTATGNSSDVFRVWDVDKDIPGIKEKLAALQNQFTQLNAEMVAINKTTNSISQGFKTSAKDLNSLLKNPNKIPNSLTTISTMQEKMETYRKDLREAPLQLDRFYVAQPQMKLPRMKVNFFEKTMNMFAILFATFSSKDQLNKQSSDDLNIWMFTGRDYVDELQQLANEKFTPEYGVKVHINLVQSGDLVVLGKAAGILPDLAIGVDSGAVYDYALRDAIYDYKKFPDSQAFIDLFAPGVMQPYRYNGGIYGIPETNNFNIMFYRKDILKQLGLTVPNTWDDLYDMLPTLLQNDSNFYMPPADFSSLFFQNNVQMYTQDGLSSALSESQGFKTFRQWTDLFNVYGLERQVNSFYNQFRNGTLPIGISDFNTYMQLLVAAPEISNEWAIAPIPGVKQPDGTIARWTSGGSPKANIIFNDTPEKKRGLAWEFIKWYMSENIQTEYGLNLEQYNGESFRWNSANVRAFAKMPWKEDDLKVILEQWQWLQEWPNVPGGYMSSREIGFAWNNAVIGHMNSRYALENGIKTINRELKRKQQEFNYTDADGRVLKKQDLLRITEPWKGAILK